MIALLVTVLMAMILYNSYAAFLTSCLAVREVQLPFRSLEEMYKTTEFKVTTVVGYKLSRRDRSAFSGSQFVATRVIISNQYQ